MCDQIISCKFHFNFSQFNKFGSRLGSGREFLNNVLLLSNVTASLICMTMGAPKVGCATLGFVVC